MKKIDIYFIARHYPPNRGGIEQLNYDTYTHFKKNKNIKIQLLKNTGHRFSIKFLLKALIKSFHIKEKNVLLGDALLSVCIPILKLRKKNVITRVHGLDITGPNFFYQQIIPKLVGLSNKVVCNSSATQNECVKRSIPKAKTVVIPPGLDFHELKSGPKDFSVLGKDSKYFKDKVILLTIGRLVKRKGVLFFLKKILPFLDKKYIYVIAGDGPDFQEIVKEAQKEELKDRVYVMGEISEKKKSKLLNLCDVFLMPNIPVENDIEGFGIAGLEANEYGKPIVGSGIDGTLDLICDGKNGYCTKGSPFAQSIGNFSKTLDMALAIDNITMFKYVKSNFSWELIIEKLIETYYLND